MPKKTTSQTQIRLTKTDDLAKVLAYFKSIYPLLSEIEIIKLILSQAYTASNKANNRLPFDMHLAAKPSLIKSSSAKSVEVPKNLPILNLSPEEEKRLTKILDEYYENPDEPGITLETDEDIERYFEDLAK